MREKALKLVHLNSGNYITYSFLKRFYWYVLIIPFFILIIGIHLLSLNGISLKSLFPIVSIILWSIAYWAMVWIIKSNCTKKTFALRFLVNGSIGIFITSLMWLFFSSWNLMADEPFLEFSFFLWMIPVYLLVSAIYILSILVRVHNGKCSKIHIKNSVVSIPLTISSMAFLGVLVSRFLQNESSLCIQHIIMAISSIILIFVPSLSHVNFVKYYYCKKYSILCDENGDYESRNLYPKKKEKNNSLIKIILLVVAIVILVFIAVKFTKGFIQGIA